MSAREGVGLALLLVATLHASACSGRRLAAPAPDGRITVEVRNQHYLDVVVLGLLDGSATRLGTETGLMDGAFDVPAHVVVVGHVRLLVDPVGSAEAYLTDPIPVFPGDVVELRVASSIGMSSWSVRRGTGDTVGDVPTRTVEQLPTAVRLESATLRVRRVWRPSDLRRIASG